MSDKQEPQDLRAHAAKLASFGALASEVCRDLVNRWSPIAPYVCQRCGWEINTRPSPEQEKCWRAEHRLFAGAIALGLDEPDWYRGHAREDSKA